MNKMKYIKLIASALLGLMLCSCSGVLTSETSYCEQYAEISRLNARIDELEENGTEIVEVYIPYEVEKLVEVYPVDYEQLQHMREDYYEMSRKLEDVYNELALKYQYSTYLWFRLKCFDLNDYAIAGILGNVMNECGGNTLDINPYALNKSRTHYGICQWSIEYHPDVFGRDIDSQIEYLVATLQEIFDTYGYLYKKGFTYADFCSIGNVDEAADAFRIIYERPGRGTEATRRYNARLAYCTFVH